MARIVYALAGEGLGHAFRSDAVIEHLKKKKHDIRIIAGDRAFDILNKKYKNVHRIGTFKIVYKENKVAYIRTLLLFLTSFPLYLLYNLKIAFIIKRFKPHILICDFEPFSNYIAAILNLHCISLDNQQTLVNCEIERRKDGIVGDFFGKLVIKLFIRKADYYLCTTFFHPKTTKANTYLVPPVIRKSIFRLTPKNKGHLLVYQTSKSNNRLFSILKRIDKRFIIYGFDEDLIDKNLIFKKTNSNLFINDLKDCSGVIINGGFTLMTEALYLKKPILSIPVKNQFEQETNAYYLDKLGFGKYIKEANLTDVNNFIDNIRIYRKNLQKYKVSDNKVVLRLLDKLIAKFSC